MGRLLKKKTESEKRKKDSSITSQVSQPEDSQAKAVQLKEEKKKQYIESQKSGASSKTEQDAVEKDTFFYRTSVFFKEVKNELEKVVWPTKKQTILSTSAALVLVILISVFLGIADSILGWIISFAFKG